MATADTPAVPPDTGQPAPGMSHVPDGGEACPDGALSREDGPPVRFHRWCETETGLRHGPDRRLYMDGSRRWEWPHFKGVSHGTVKFWDRDGALTEQHRIDDEVSPSPP